MHDKEYRNMVKEMLDEEDKGFSNWEVEFLDDMFKKTIYSEKERNKIEEIYRDKM